MEYHNFRHALNQEDIIFHESNDYWNNGHFYCRSNGRWRQHMGRQCEIYEDVVTGQLGMEILTQRQQDAIHVFFIERSELSDGRNTIEIGGFAHALGSSDHRNYVVLTGQQFEYLQPDRNDLEMSDKTAKRFAHEIALLMGTYHDFGDPTNIMSMRIMG